ncbi:MAG: carbohydrate kinase family protein [Acidobacteria bacterium]|nr:carbohydrate kinase family protein [Acidobacteriota bacterium]
MVAGSLAFDHIMTFPGLFKDHIFPDKLDVINISFLVDKMERKRGGCAGNIAYSLALLGEHPRIVATAGNDFEDYRRFLLDQGVDVEAIRIIDDETTACAFITTDQSDSQIQGFYVGAMAHASQLSLKELAGDRAKVCIISPDDPGAISRHCQEAREAALAFFFDPSFQVTHMDGPTLRDCAHGAKALMLNDYEYAVFEDKTSYRGDAVFELVDFVVVTLGAKGSRILRPGSPPIEVPPVAVARAVDPTGAGDAFRAGFLAGWVEEFELPVCGRMGSVASAYAVEQYGTQTHAYSRDEFDRRYAENFGEAPR